MEDIFFKCSVKTKTLTGKKGKREKEKQGRFTLRNVDFTVNPGEVIGVIGRNGTGKTTLLRLLLGQYRFQEGDVGEISLLGHDSKRDQKQYREGLAFVLTDQPFDREITPLAVGEIYGKYYPGFSMEAYVNRLSEYGIFAGDGHFIKERDKKVPERTGELTELSTGEGLKLQLAFALSHDASLMIMDEPTGNLDVNFRNGFYEAVRDYVSDERHSVILSSHLTEEVEQIADKILWLGREERSDADAAARDADAAAGYVRYFGTVDDLKEQYRMVEADAALLELLSPKQVVGKAEGTEHSEALVKVTGYQLPEELERHARYADLREIFYYVEKGEIGGQRDGI